MNWEFKKIMEIERQLMEARNKLCNEACQTIGKEVEDAAMPGVTVSSGSIRAATVSFSAIAGSKGFVLAPEYYISKSQSDLVTSALAASAKRDGASGLRDKLADMVSNRSVTVKGVSHQLNPYTVSVLENALAEM